MDKWFCTVCETVNEKPDEPNILHINKRCKLCNTYEITNEKQFDNYLTINNHIDNFVPRHIYDIEICYATIQLISSSVHHIYPPRVIYDYTRNRLHYRNYYINKRWRRNTCYKRFLKIILKYINNNRTKIEDCLILQFLLH